MMDQRKQLEHCCIVMQTQYCHKDVQVTIKLYCLRKETSNVTDDLNRLKLVA